MNEERPESTPDRRIELLVLLGAALVVGYHAVAQYQPYSFLHGDGSFYAIINRSLSEGTLDQERFQPMSWYRERLRWNDELDPAWSDLALGADGRTLWPKHPVLLPLLHVPLFHAFGLDGLLVGSVLMTVLSIWLAYRIAARACSAPAAATAALFFASTPLLLHNAYSYSNDVLYTVLALGAIDATQRLRGLSAGLLWGLALAAKPTIALLAAPFGAQLAWARQWRVLGRMALGAAGPLGALAVANTVMFGGPLTQGYNRIVVRHGGAQGIFDIRGKFGRAVAVGLRAILDDPNQGIRRLGGNNPMYALAGIVPLLRSSQGRRFAFSFAASLALTLLFYARFEFTYARFFTPWIVLAVVPAAALLDASAALLRRALAWPRTPGWLRALLGDPRCVAALAGAVTLRAAVRAAPQFSADLLAWTLVAALFHAELWSLLAAAMTRAGAWLTGRRVAALAAGLAVLTALAPPLVRRVRRPSERWIAADALADARVRIVPPGGRAVPCDYLNPARQKWECTDWEQGDWTSWGRAIGPECGFAEGNRHFLWLHPNPNVAREIAWSSLPPGDLRVRFGAAPLSQHADVTAELSSGTARRTLRPTRVGALETLVIPAAERGVDLRITVPAQTHDWRQLCVEVAVP